MASIHGGDDEYARNRFQSNDGQTPLYSSGNTDNEGDEWSRRSERPGPLAARLSRRQQNTTPPTNDDNIYQHFSRSPFSAYGGNEPQAPQASAGAPYHTTYEPGYDPNTSRQGPSWEKVTGALRLEESAASAPDALFTDLGFGATWNSRAEMLRACLDEYYRVVNSFNDTRRLLEISESDLEPLRRDQMMADARVRDAEIRLEFQSRTELRTIYLGAAEIEVRLFRAEQEHQSLSNRLELLEGFMMFLSRIIATVRAIPEGALLRDTGHTPHAMPYAASDSHAVADQSTMLISPDHTSAVDLQPTMLAANRTHKLSLPGAENEDEIEELIVDERDVTLLASGEFEIVEVLDDGDNQTQEKSES